MEKIKSTNTRSTDGAENHRISWCRQEKIETDLDNESNPSVLGERSVTPKKLTRVSLIDIPQSPAERRLSNASTCRSPHPRRRTSSCDIPKAGTDSELRRVIRQTIKGEFKIFTEQFRTWFEERMGNITFEGSERTKESIHSTNSRKPTLRHGNGSVMLNHQTSGITSDPFHLDASASFRPRSEPSGEDTDDLAPKEQDLAEAIKRDDIFAVEKLLESRADPAAEIPSFKPSGTQKKFTNCSLLAAAAMCGNTEIARLLVEYDADPCESLYGFSAGMMAMEWRGSAIFATIRNGAADLEMLQELVDLEADINAVSTNGANLVWQSCYFGHVPTLSLLLERHVPCDRPARSQNLRGVSHTPLHIAAMQDRGTAIIEKLIAAKADIDLANEDKKTPLLDAILLERVKVVQCLVSHGAKLVPDIEEERPLDILFGKNNPLLLKAAAIGLADQEKQIKACNSKDLYKLLSCPQSKSEMLHALFKKRSIRYWDAKTGTEKVMNTAKIRNSKIVHGGKFHRFANVAAYTEDSANMEMFLKQKLEPDANMKRFLDDLSHAEDGTWRWFKRSISGYTLTLTSVETFEAVVGDFHDDMRIIKAIADSSVHEACFNSKSCEAILQYAWKGVRWYTVSECVLNFLLLIICLILAYHIGKGVTCMCDHSERIAFIAACGLPLDILFLIREVLRVVAYAKHGLSIHFTMNFACSSNLMDAVLLISLFYTRGDLASRYWFRLVYSLNCISRWLNVIYSLAPVRRLGLRLVPIMYTVSSIWPFFTVFCVCIMAFTTALISLGLEDHWAGETLTNVFMFGTVAEPEFLPQTAHVVGLPEGFVFRVLFCGFTIFVSITMMNCFIAAMTASYAQSNEAKHQLYQVRLAAEIFKHFATRHSIKWLYSICGGEEKRERRYLWYAVKPEEKMR